MSTQSTPNTFPFQTNPKGETVVSFTGGHFTADGGALLLADVERATGILQQTALCFTDHRDPALIEHSVRELLAQRIYGLALGYEDLNDHDDLRADPLLAALVGKTAPLGEQRLRDRDVGKALAGKSTLNRLELTPPEATETARYKKIVAQPEALADLFVTLFLQAHTTPPQRLVLDLDATDDPLHGQQEGRFFHGHYRTYCYLPLYIFCGAHLLCAKLRTAAHGAAYGCLAEIQRLVGRLRQAWPEVQIILRGDADFSLDDVMTWCEAAHVDYVFGLAPNKRLLEALAPELQSAHARHLTCGVACRVWGELRYRTLKSWSCERRVVGKAEHLPGGPNPRFVVTTLPVEQRAAKEVYEVDYCGRGDMENRLKEQKLDVAAGRTSAATLLANQLRLWFASLAYVLLSGLRRLGLAETELATAQCGTLRHKLLKLSGWVRTLGRQLQVVLSRVCKWQAVFAHAWAALRRLPTAVVPLRPAVAPPGPGVPVAR